MTLLEILIALSIVTVLLALLIPNFKPFRMKAQVRTSARNLAALIRYGRSAAIYNHRLMHLRIDLENHQYRLDLMRDSKRASDRDADEREMVEEIRVLPDRVMFDRAILYNGQGEVRGKFVILDLSPRGNVTPATIILSDTDGQERMTVDIFGTTGAVEVYEGAPEDYAEAQEQSS